MPPPPSFILLLFLPFSPTISFTFPFISFCHALKKGFTFFYWLWVMLSCFFPPFFPFIFRYHCSPAALSLSHSLTLTLLSILFFLLLYSSSFHQTLFSQQVTTFQSINGFSFFFPGGRWRKQACIDSYSQSLRSISRRGEKKMIEKIQKPKKKRKRVRHYNDDNNETSF